MFSRPETGWNAASLIVLSPRVRTFRTPEEPDLTLIGSTELAKPPEGEVVLALRALDLDGGEGFYLLIFIIDDGNLLLLPGFVDFQLVRTFDLPDIPAFFTLELTAGGDEHALAFWTKHRYNHAQYEKINLWIPAVCRRKASGRFPFPAPKRSAP